ncbi:hypothetical protein F5Y16DRAFT_85120 [Xylariaceae sp. FL0255]|nr:hypothetical protein F5Y16DRAFT_85120 [Xylariaceae sp. FL0255]
MLFNTILATTFAGLASAAYIKEGRLKATVVVTTGVPGDYSNTTVVVPIDENYTSTALDQVSTLYLVRPTGVECTAFSGNGFNSTFTVGSPAFLSTNDVVIDSLQCGIEI